MVLLYTVMREIQFLSWNILFVAMSIFAHVQSHHYVTWSIYAVVFLLISVS